MNSRESLWGEWEEMRSVRDSDVFLLTLSLHRCYKGARPSTKSSLTKYLRVFHTSLGSSPYVFTISDGSLVSQLNTKSNIKG